MALGSLDSWTYPFNFCGLYIVLLLFSENKRQIEIVGVLRYEFDVGLDHMNGFHYNQFVYQR